MFTYAGLPSVNVRELAARRQNGAVVLDVREPMELKLASLPGDDVVNLPLSVLAEKLLDAIPADISDKSTEIFVICHTGNRSAQVTAWLRQQGWENVYNITGGIEAYSTFVDDSVPHY